MHHAAPAQSNQKTTTLALERLRQIEDTLAEKHLTARLALEIKFFLTAHDARGRERRVLLDVPSLQSAIVREGEPVIIKRQVAADRQDSMYEINIDAWHLGAPADFKARIHTPSQVAACAETFKAELADRLAQAAQEGKLRTHDGKPLTTEMLRSLTLRLEPRPFKASERLSSAVMWTDVNSMHVNVSLQHENGENVFRDDATGLRHRCAQALLQQQPAALFATMPTAESYERLGANPAVPGRAARFLMGPRQDHAPMFKKMAATHSLDPSGLMVLIPVLLGGRDLAKGISVSAAGIGVAQYPLQDHAAKLGLVNPSSKMHTPETARIEDRLYAAETNAALASLLTLAPVARTAVRLLEEKKTAPFRRSEYQSVALPQTPEAAYEQFQNSPAMLETLGDELHRHIALTYCRQTPARGR